MDKLEVQQVWIRKNRDVLKPYRDHLNGRYEELVVAIIASDDPCLILKGKARMLKEQIQALS